MKEIKGNIWDYYDKGNWIVITTNGTVKKNGECVMGRGVAREAKLIHPGFPLELGKAIKEFGNCVFEFSYRILTMPVKHHWYEKADLKLIEASCQQLVEHLIYESKLKELYMVRPGCGNGRLDWKDVKPILEKYLDDRFIIVERREE